MMAFHVACPITCERICFCDAGFRRGLRTDEGKRAFEEAAARVQEFLRDPWSVKPGEGGCVRVLVPKVEVAPPPPVMAAAAAGVIAAGPSGGGGIVFGEEDGDELGLGTSSASNKRAALQKAATAASLAAEDYVRKLEMGWQEDVPGEVGTDHTKGDQTALTAKVICRICVSGENEGSIKASKMVTCKFCNKKYHRSCVKNWGDNRDLFHWSSWACPSCRICEICRRTGDPNKFMFCKRCDAGYHCYCLQPPHKNVSRGPYLCPKHTRCHSCGSTVHGSGHSTRWFLGYNFCDACGRLFTKEKYCPVCLKVYRDSESTPMVCCDVCQRWVHCSCDGISDEKYLQFQADRNLYYKCAACRGDCYQVKDIDDAVQELWRRRDKADRDLIISLKLAAGLPTEDELISICPSSDEEEAAPVILKGDSCRSLKFSLKGMSDKFVKTCVSNQKHIKRKGSLGQLSAKTEEPFKTLDRSDDTRSLDSNFVDEKSNGVLDSGGVGPANCSSQVLKISKTTKLKFSIDQSRNVASSNQETGSTSGNETFKIGSKDRQAPSSSLTEGTVKHGSKSEQVKGTKLVIHLGGRNKNLTSSPRSEASSCQRENEKALSNCSEESSQDKLNDGGHLVVAQGRDGLKVGSGANDKSKVEDGLLPATKKSFIFKRRRVMETHNEAGAASSTIGGIESPSKSRPTNASVGIQSEAVGAVDTHSVSNSSKKDSKPLLKLKFKNPYSDNQSLSVSNGQKIIRRQRSKRKRPSHLMEKSGLQETVSREHSHQDDGVDDDANWILQRLGKNAIGKRVEVHQPLGNSWKKGVVADVIGGTTLSVDLDDGSSRTLELGKQAVRLIPQKQKRTKW